GHFQTSFGALIHADLTDLKEAHMARAKWFWHRKQERQAVQELQDAIKRLPPPEGVSWNPLTSRSTSVSSVGTEILMKDGSLDKRSETFIIAKVTHHSAIIFCKPMLVDRSSERFLTNNSILIWCRCTCCMPDGPKKQTLSAVKSC